MEAEPIRSVAPGEMLVIQGKRLQSYRICDPKPVRQCIFELVYFARPDSEVFGEVVYERRKEMGATLAHEAPVDADYVMTPFLPPLPSSTTNAGASRPNCSPGSPPRILFGRAGSR